MGPTSLAGAPSYLSQLPQGSLGISLNSQGNPIGTNATNQQAMSTVSNYLSPPPSGNKTISHDQAIAMGLDVNKLPSGYSLSGGGGGGSTAPQSAPNPYDMGDWQNKANMEAAMRAQMEADINSASSGYDAIRQNLEAQKGVLGQTYNTGLTDVNNQINQSLSMADLNKQQLGQQGEQQKTSAYQNYLTAQRQNREAARAAGAGPSSAYLDVQGQTNTGYGQTLANIGTNLTNQIAQIDTSINALNQNATNAKQKLADQYNSAIQNIVLNENQTDTQKANAVAQIRAGFGSQMAQLNQYTMQLQQQMTLAREQMANQLQIAQTYARSYTPLPYNNQPTAVNSTLATSAPATNTQGLSMFGTVDNNKYPYAGNVNTSNNQAFNLTGNISNDQSALNNLYKYLGSTTY